MSWDATFYIIDVDGDRHWLGDWNYTHNTSRMIYAALDENAAGRERYADGRLGSWYDVLDSLNGSEGHNYLERILAGLRADPVRFRTWNPDNGWGNYDQLVTVLSTMAALSRKFPAGVWETSG